MAQDQQLVDVNSGTGWTQLTNADVASGSTITFQVREGMVEVHATINTTEPTSGEYGIVYRTLEGERLKEISEIIHLASAVRLWARALGADGAKVYVDHA